MDITLIIKTILEEYVRINDPAMPLIYVSKNDVKFHQLNEDSMNIETLQRKIASIISEVKNLDDVLYFQRSRPILFGSDLEILNGNSI
jgi:hypothetical protein